MAADGLRTAVATVGVGEAPAIDGDQLELLPDLLGLPEVPVERRGPGRPKGARNKRTEEWTAYLLGRYHSPLEALLQLGLMPVQELARSLNCTMIEALAEKRQALAAILPYLHQRQPIAVDVTKRQVVHLTIHEAPDQDLGVAAAIEAAVIDIEQNQSVSEGESDAV